METQNKDNMIKSEKGEKLEDKRILKIRKTNKKLDPDGKIRRT